MTSNKSLVSFIVSGLQWLVLCGFALTLALAIMLIGALVYSACNPSAGK